MKVLDAVLRTRGGESYLVVRCVRGENNHESPQMITSDTALLIEILGNLST